MRLFVQHLRWVLLSFVLIFCTRTSTQEMLEANFVAQNQQPIDLILPANNQQVTNSNLQFSWSVRGGNLYTLQVATDAAFKNLVLNKDIAGNSYVYQPSDLVSGATIATGTYYWRVKIALISANLQSKAGTFLLVAMPSGNSGYAGVLYVDGSSSNSVQVGSKDAPYKKIQTAVSAADVLRNGNKDISFDIFVAQGAYSDEISMLPGISVRGGYENTAWTRNITGYTTTITAKADVAFRCSTDIGSAYTTTTVIEGFTINGGNSPDLNIGVSVTGGFPTIKNNIIGATGIGNVAAGQVTTSAAGIYINQAGPIISYNTISAAGGNTTHGRIYGILLRSNSTPTINANTISSSAQNVTGNAEASAAAIFNEQGNSAPVITNNVIKASTASTLVNGNAFGYRSYSPGAVSSNTILVNNTIAVSATSGVARGIADVEGNLIIANNIIFTTAGATRYCIDEGGGINNPASLQNNLIIDCANALYLDAGVTARTTEAQINVVGNTVGAGIATGNLGPTSVANFAAVNFSSTSDYHLTASTPAVVRNGGLNGGQSVCGSAGASGCGNVTTDRDGNPRTLPYSMGAYEF